MGRQKKYEEAEVLDKAMFSFWKYGYEHLSMRQLEKDMGINQFSIYASFQNKENLFRLVLHRYKEYIENEFLEELQSEEASLNDIKNFLLNFSHSIQVGTVPNGCLMVNTSMEVSEDNQLHYELVKSYFSRIEDSFKRVLSNQKKKGELNDSIDVDQSALFLLGIAQSISILSKTQSRGEIESYISYAINSLT